MKSNHRHMCLVLIITILITTRGFSWGWEAHKVIHEHAVAYLPPEMAFFKAQQGYLMEHAPDPDKTKNRPGYWHYIDIDHYPEYFTGTMPIELPKMLALYDWKTVSGNGIVPWAIGYEMDSLMTLMADGIWDMAWQAAADLGHYVADSHQPLHLTANYNGQLTGNKGIHSRYETKMIDPHLDELMVPAGQAVYLDNVSEKVFEYIHQLYPDVARILAADSMATTLDPAQDSTYYAVMWAELDSITIDALNRAALDLASIWYTTWVNAGCPYPPGMRSSNASVNGISLNLEKANFPFMKPALRITYTLPGDLNVTLGIYDKQGQLVTQLVREKQNAGAHTIKWKYEPQINEGIYFTRLSAGNTALAAKIEYKR